jgi:MoaA/NifB/PqqE/SkfB family radical SAM enzyme
MSDGDSLPVVYGSQTVLMSPEKAVAAYGTEKILRHPEKLWALKEGRVTAPIAVRVKPENACPHSCFWCSYSAQAIGSEDNDKNMLAELYEKRARIPVDKMLEILDDFREMGVKGVTFSGGGEPLIYPWIEQTLKRAIDNGLDISVITNGQRLSGKIAEYLSRSKWVRISLDACTAETAEATRKIAPARFNEIVENMRHFAEIKVENCEFGINFVISHKNYHEVYDAAKFFQELGLDHIKFTPRWIDHDQVDSSTGLGWIDYHAPFKESVINQINRAKRDFSINIYDTYENDFNLTGKNFRPYVKCPTIEITPVIAADQMVYTCHDKAYTDLGKIGSIKDKSFKELWYSEATKEFIRNFDPQEKCRHHCTYDSRNILTNDIVDGKLFVSKEMVDKVSDDSVNFP